MTHMRIIYVVLVGVAAGLVVAQIPVAKNIDYLVFDYLMGHSGTNSTAGNVAIVGIDDISLERFPEPLILWHKKLAKVIRALSANNAKAIGLDIIMNVSLSNIAPDMDTYLMRAMRAAVAAGSPIILGYKAGEGGIEPHRKFLFVASGKGYVNLTPDQDQVIRRQRLAITGNGMKYQSLVSMLATKSPRYDRLNDSDELIIDFRFSPPPVYSMAQVYEWAENGNIEQLKTAFAGKIVLVGVTTSKLPDHHRVPLTGKERLAGVIIHGITLETLLSGKYLKNLTQAQIWVTAIIVAIITGILYLYLSPAIATVISISVIYFILLATYFLFGHNILAPVSPFISGILVPALVSGLYRYSTEYSQFRTLQKYFKSYVSPHILQQLIDNPQSATFGGDMVTATVMFTDIRGFTTLSETIPADKLIMGLNVYFTEMTAAVTSHDGYLNKYIGDGILAIFGAPNKLPYDGALAAVKCGLDMQKRLEGLNRSRVFPHVDQLEIGIGIHTGVAVVGNAGCSDKMEYSIFGDTVNLAARIESETKNHSAFMLISSEAMRRVEKQIKAEYAVTTKVKGRNQEVALYKVISIKEGGT